MFDEEEDGGGYYADAPERTQATKSSKPRTAEDLEIQHDLLVEDFLSIIGEGELELFKVLLSIPDLDYDDLAALCYFDINEHILSDTSAISEDTTSQERKKDHLELFTSYFKRFALLPFPGSYAQLKNAKGELDPYTCATIAESIIQYVSQIRILRRQKRIGVEKEAVVRDFINNFPSNDLDKLALFLSLDKLSFTDLENLVNFDFDNFEDNHPLMNVKYGSISCVLYLGELEDYFVARYPDLPISKFLAENTESYSTDDKLAKEILGFLQSQILKGRDISRDKHTYGDDSPKAPTVSPTEITGIAIESLNLGNEIANGGICSRKSNAILTLLGELKAQADKGTILSGPQNFFDRQDTLIKYSYKKVTGLFSTRRNNGQQERLENALNEPISHNCFGVGRPVIHESTGYEISFAFAEHQVGFVVNSTFVPIIELEDNRQDPTPGKCSGTIVNTDLFASQFPQGMISLSHDEDEIISTVDEKDFMLAAKDTTRGDGFFVVADVLNIFRDALNPRPSPMRQAAIERLYNLFSMDFVVAKTLNIEWDRNYRKEIRLRQKIYDATLAGTANPELLSEVIPFDDPEDPTGDFEHVIRLIPSDNNTVVLERYITRPNAKVGNRQNLYALTFGAALGDVSEKVFSDAACGLVSVTPGISSIIGDERTMAGFDRISKKISAAKFSQALL